MPFLPVNIIKMFCVQTLIFYKKTYRETFIIYFLSIVSKLIFNSILSSHDYCHIEHILFFLLL